MGTIVRSNVLDIEDDSGEKNKKEQENYAYIMEHKHNVIIAFKKLFIPVIENRKTCTSVSSSELYNAIKVCSERIEKHDESKFSAEEFDAYRLRFYPTTKEKASPDYDRVVDELFEKQAWPHHHQHNEHHPEHWIDERGNPIDMDLPSIVEMICDWEAMSMKFGQNTIEWYTESAKKEKFSMSPRTKEITEDLLFNLLVF